MKNAIIEKAIEIKGSQGALAQALGISQAMVSKMLNGNAKIAAEIVIPLERIFDGSVTRHDIAPHLYPSD